MSGEIEKGMMVCFKKMLAIQKTPTPENPTGRNSV